MAQNRHTGKLLHAGRCAADGRLLDRLRDVQVEPSVMMLAIFFLQRVHQRAQRPAFLRHDVGQKQCIEQPIAFRQMPANADAARFFAADEDVLLQHQFAYMLEADAMLVKLCARIGPRCGPASWWC